MWRNGEVGKPKNVFITPMSQMKFLKLLWKYHGKYKYSSWSALTSKR